MVHWSGEGNYSNFDKTQVELVAYSTSHHFITRIFYRKLRGKSYFSRKANDNDALFVNYNLGVVMSRVEWSREAGRERGGGVGGC